MYNVLTTSNKEVRINIKLRRQLRAELQIAAELRGLTVSGLLHQFIVKTVREEKERSPAEFTAAKVAARADRKPPAEGEPPKRSESRVPA